MKIFENTGWQKGLLIIVFFCANAYIYAQKLSMGYQCVHYICEDSTISAIGNNEGYQLGDGTVIERHYPVKIKGIHNAIAVNSRGSLALLNDGTVWQWRNKNNVYALKKIDIDNVIAISSGIQPNGGRFYCALKNDGSLWLWGDQDNSQYGGVWWGYKDSLEKMDIPKVKKIQGGSFCIIALCEDGSVWTWGSSLVNGNGNSPWSYPNYSIVKPQKVETVSNVIDITAGGMQETVWILKTDGTVWYWGWLTDYNTNIPSQMTLNDVKSIYTGTIWSDDGFYVLKNDGSLLFFNGLLWHPERIDTIVTVKNITFVASYGESVSGISTYVQDGNGSLWRWGYNASGQLGNFTTFPIDSPEIMPHQCVAVNCDTITKNPDILKSEMEVHPGSLVTLTASSSDADLYWWYPKSNVISGRYSQQVTVKIKDDTEFSAVIMDTYGCMRKERFMLRKKCNTGIKTTLDTVTFPGAKLVLVADTGSQYTWSPSTNLSCYDCKKTTATVSTNVTYTVSYTDIYTCPVKEEFIIRIRDCDTIIKNAGKLMLDSIITPGIYVHLTASDAVSYEWLPKAGLSCYTCQNTVARIYNNTEYTVTITDKYECKWTERYKLTNLCKVTPDIIDSIITYPTAQIQLNLPEAKTYFWQPQNGLSNTNSFNPIITVSNLPITYDVILTDSFNCITRQKFIIIIRDCDSIQPNEPVVRLNDTVYYPQKIPLMASESYAGYKWTPSAGLSCDNCQNPILSANTTANYIVEVFDEWHCPFNEVFIITMIMNDVIIPNVFTPNNDGINDNFEIKSLLPGSELKVFDSYGEMVFSSADYENNWYGLDNSGKQLEEGTYWYILNMQHSKSFKGWVYLKR
jgi:gliding motility-associated-like protein